MRGRITIHDVARAAGVSHQTVSNVLRGSGRVGLDTRERVARAAAELNYRPHSGAASLRTRRSGRLAYPISAGDLGRVNTIMLEFVQALTDAARARDHHLLLTTDGTVSGVSDLEDLARAGAVDAVVLADVAREDPRVAALAALGVPFSCFGRTASDLPQTWVDIDNHAGVHAATTHLIRRGHREIAFLGYIPQGDWDLAREAGYRDALASAGLTATVRTPEPDSEQVPLMVDQLLDADPRPSAIVTGSDVLAGAVYARAAQHGLVIGRDVAVTGFDGSVVGRLLAPALTTVSIPVERIASLMIDRVLAELDGPTGEPGVLLAPQLVVGASG